MGPFFGAAKALLLAQALTGVVVGHVTDSESGQAVSGAVVTLAETSHSTAADDNGRYCLSGIPAGPTLLTVHFVGYADRSLRAFVPPADSLLIDFELSPDPLPMRRVVVRAPLDFDFDSGGVRSFPDRTLSWAALRNDPLSAEPDALRSLDGGAIALRPESPSGVNIRGGASDETAYVLDGIPVINPYHAAGLASGWNPDALAAVQVGSAVPEPGAHALGGVVDAVTREPGDRVLARGGVSTNQSRLTVDGPLGARAGYLVSLRSGLTDLLAPKGETSYIHGEVGDWLTKFRANAIGGGLEILAYGNTNQLNAAAAVAPEENTAATDTRRNGFDWSSRSVGARWSRAMSPVSVSVAAWRAGGDAGSSWEGTTAPLHMTAARRDVGVLAELERDGGGAVSAAQLRFESSRTAYRVSSDSLPDPSLDLTADVPVLSAFIHHRRTLGAFEVRAGGSLVETRGQWRAGPNASATWRPSPRVEVSRNASRTHQFAQSLRNPESVVGNLFPADLYIGTGGRVPVSRSDLGVIAARLRPHRAFELTVQGYARRSEDLLLVAPVEAEPFATASWIVGSGRSHGISADLTRSTSRSRTSLGYAFQETRLRYPGGSYVPEAGARHALHAGFVFNPSASLSLRIGATAALGRRVTPIADGFEWEATNLLDRGSEFGGSPHMDPSGVGATALPTYNRVDVGVRKEWRLGLAGRDATLALFGTATNLLGRTNYLTYAPDPISGRPVGIEMRPRSPLVVGVDWEF